LSDSNFNYMPASGYPRVSVLFITYRRVDFLRMALEAFLRNTDYPNLEIVIADDGSGPEIQAEIRTLPANVFALLPKNRGLGANNNNGIRHCSGKYILMIQDDCECCGPSDYLRNTVQVMEANPEIGIVNYCGEPHPFDESQPLRGSTEPCYITPQAYTGGTKEHFLYSDQPHVVSRAAVEDVGYYLEDRDIEKCEVDYNIRWRDQKRFATAVFPAYYKRTYAHQGSDQSFRTTRVRHKVARLLQPAKPFLVRYAHPLFRIGKATVNGGVRALERLRLVR
jgi:glycosyltransferase involved in cell wall biosynthesis